MWIISHTHLRSSEKYVEIGVVAVTCMNIHIKQQAGQCE